MASYMLDTDVASYIVKRSSRGVLKKLQNTPVSDVCISVITKCELLYGVEISPRKDKDEAAVEGFLRHIEVLDFPTVAAVDYAQIRAHLKVRGTMIGSNDLWIAAHARCLALTLVTHNVREFGRVPGLTIDDWLGSARS